VDQRAESERRANATFDALLGAELLIAIAVNRLERAGEAELLAQAQELHAAIRSRCWDAELARMEPQP
jgi:hypothetical protein